ncbi:histidine phosphatase family protein [Lentzea sp. CC55]|uniref:histidine phosphatase family protein n=1 Tax=Lentzea sp. CC55 TaxID=2884909 RepID=UPI0027DF4A64|nr:histidine phosphatase family protein [Lentzea sp. CC55]MCG8921040.1 phosphoglycerate mutase family protein [Lentzea sp. CC55]
MQSFILIRHAETLSNSRARWHGDSDEPISPHGRKEAAAAALRLRAMGQVPRLIVCSGLLRARQTAEIFAQAVGPVEVVSDSALGERDMGDWKGLAPSEVEDRWPGRLAAWEAGLVEGPPNGETDSAVTVRALDVLAKFTDLGKGLVLVVTHGGIIRSLRKAQKLPNIPVPHLGGCWTYLRGSAADWSVGPEVVFGDPESLPKT